MEKEIRKQIENIAKEKGITFEEEIEIIRKGFDEPKTLNDISDKQRSFIKAIENKLSIKFKGHTKLEAREFISTHIEEYNRAKNTRHFRPKTHYSSNYSQSNTPVYETYAEEVYRENEEYYRVHPEARYEDEGGDVPTGWYEW